MKVVAVLGGGLMGSGICTACLLNGIDVVLKEVNQQALDAGVGRVRANLSSRVKKRILTNITEFIHRRTFLCFTVSGN